MKTDPTPWTRLVHLAALVPLLLAACGPARISQPPTSTLPPALPSSTAAAAPATQVPTSTPASAATPAATEPPAPTVTAAPSATVLPSATPTQETTPAPAEPLTDRAAFVSDVTAPDGSPYRINTSFAKTWRVKNVGTATWTVAYALVFVKGEAMTTTTEIPLQAAVGPGETVDLTINLVVPDKTGRVRGFWQLRNAAGTLFGVGPDANEPIYVDIFAVTEKAANGPPVQVNSVSLSIANGVVSAPCPYDLVLNGRLGLNDNGTGRVTAELEATFSDPTFKFSSPGVADFNFLGFEANPFPFVYTLTFVGNTEAQFRMHVLTPNDLRSEPVSFSLTCTSAAAPTAAAAATP